MSMLPPDPIYIFKGNMEPVFCVAFKITSSVEQVFAGTQAGIVHVWNINNKREVNNFKISDKSCLSINIYEDYVITQDKSGCISFWKEENENKWICVKNIVTDFFGFCKFFIFQDLLYACLKNGRIQVISNKTIKPIRTFDITDNSKLGEIMALRVLRFNCDTLILVAFEGSQLILFNSEKEKQLSKLQLEECPMALDFDSKSMKGICGNPSDKILIFLLTKCFDFMVNKYIKLMNPGVASVQIRPDSRIVAVGCWDGKLRLYSWKTLVLLAVLEIHSSTIENVAFSEGWKDGGKVKCLLAAGSKDCKVSLWDLYN